MSLNNLAANLEERFEAQGVPSTLILPSSSIGVHYSPPPTLHSDRSMSLDNLAVSLGERFEQWGVPSDLDRPLRSIGMHYSSPTTRSFRSIHLSAILPPLGNQIHAAGVSSDLDEVFQLFLQLSHPSHAASTDSLSVAKSWGICRRHEHDSALLAYKTALKFLDQQVALLSSSSRHFDVISKAVSSLATDAFSCSVRCGALTTAVELVEQGRAVFWTQLARFSTPLDELSVSGDTGAALAEEFKD
ncbi:hypothetical protein DEU56DRAFT_980461 [Suillus clintonianus]|uniref:uncharacterized protein n=1 Tax=Suillus clintonianus TaxID=1904413 RepID=UPI001B8606C5|nr:uncharacterized protein DEU56DRAFT_980461 [Suillus clintonianus]KAG2139071.1 hypothetical protein DEU56DRAFT_980461 [Suillus clintonianus]